MIEILITSSLRFFAEKGNIEGEKERNLGAFSRNLGRSVGNIGKHCGKKRKEI